MPGFLLSGIMAHKQADPDQLRKLIEESGIEFRTNTRSYLFDCPKCGKKDKLAMLKGSGRFVCWYCREIENFQGAPEYALRELTGMALPIIQKRLYGTDEIQAQVFLECSLRDYYDDGEDAGLEGREGKALIPLALPIDFYPIDHKHAIKGLEYLDGRGIPLDIAKQYDLQYWTTRRRVVFPIAMGGKYYGWQGRTIDPTEWIDEEGNLRKRPKSLNNIGGEGANSRDYMVMFADRLNGSDHAIVCEGPIDAIKAHKCGGNIATMGKAVTPSQVAFLRNAGIRKVYLALDPDAADETARLVRSFDDLEVYFMEPDSGFKDFGEMSFEATYRSFLSAERVTGARLFTYHRLPKFA